MSLRLPLALGIALAASACPLPLEDELSWEGDLRYRALTGEDVEATLVEDLRFPWMVSEGPHMIRTLGYVSTARVRELLTLVERHAGGERAEAARWALDRIGRRREVDLETARAEYQREVAVRLLDRQEALPARNEALFEVFRYELPERFALLSRLALQPDEDLLDQRRFDDFLEHLCAALTASDSVEALAPLLAWSHVLPHMIGRVSAIAEFARIVAQSEAPDVLTGHLRDDHRRELAALCLLELGDERGLEVGARITEYPDEAVRQAAIGGLGRLLQFGGGETPVSEAARLRVISVMETALDHEDEDVRAMALENLAESGMVEAVAPLLARFARLDSWAKTSAARLFFEHPQALSDDDLILLASCEDGAIAQRATERLVDRAAGGARVVAFLEAQVFDDREAVRLAALSGLMLAPRVQVATLRRLIEDEESPGVRAAMWRLLAQHPPASLLDAVLEAEVRGGQERAAHKHALSRYESTMIARFESERAVVERDLLRWALASQGARRLALRVAAKVGSRSLLPQAAAMMGDGERDTRLAALDYLTSIPDALAGALDAREVAGLAGRAVDRADSALASRLTAVLGECGALADVPELLALQRRWSEHSALRGASPDFPQAVARIRERSEAHLGAERAMDELFALAKRRDEEVLHRFAIDEIARSNSPRRREYLERYAKSGDEGLAALARKHLARLEAP